MSHKISQGNQKIHRESKGLLRRNKSLRYIFCQEAQKMLHIRRRRWLVRY